MEQGKQKKEQTSTLGTPLIQNHSTQEIINNGQEIIRESKRKAIIEEVKKQLWLAGPLISVNLLLYCLQLISLMFVGHLGEIPLSGASIATSFASVTGFTLLMGLASALDTFCGQSYGAKQYHLLGIHLQRAMLIVSLVSIPLAVVWANTEPILLALGQNPQIAAEAGQYAQFMIPSLFAYGLLQCLLRFLQTQNIVFPMMVTSAIAAVVHVLLCWVLVMKTGGLGSRGAAVSSVVSYWVNVVLLGAYVKLSPSCVETWGGFSMEAMSGIPGFLKLAIPSACMICLELWSFEMVVLLAGLLPNPALETSALSISLNTELTVWMISVGLGGAVSTRVSNELGAGRPESARLAVSVVLCLAVAQGTVVGSTLILIRHIWGYAYSNEREVAEYLAKMMPILALSNFLDGVQAVLSGSVRGCGWQKIGAYINLGSYYLVGLPSAVLLAFVFHVGGRGIWLGIICALIVQAGLLMLITLRTNWEQQAIKATDRVYESVIPPPQDSSGLL